MGRKIGLAVMLAAGSAWAVDPCAEAVWAGNEIIGAQKAQEHLIDVQLAHCRPPKAHPACPAYALTTEALAGYIEQLTAILSLRKKECAAGR